MRRFAVVLTNALLAFVTASSVGPAASKLEGVFGLVGAPARLPFYLLQLYISLVILATRRTAIPLVGGAMIGIGFAIPLALWSVATKCPPAVPTVYLLSGLGQGVLLAWLSDRLAKRSTTGAAAES